MAVTSSSGAPPSSKPPAGPASSQARGGVAGGLLKRFLTLREGSIIVVTLITLIYFSATTSNFVTGANFKSLLPYFAPLAILAGGQVFVMTTRRDRPVDRRHVPVLAVPVRQVLQRGDPPAHKPRRDSAGDRWLLGAINGFFVAYVGIASFVATLGMLFFARRTDAVISHATNSHDAGHVAQRA